MMNYEDIPLIKDVRYLRGHDLIIKFTNGEERVVDMSESFEVPAAQKYAPQSLFKKFSFNKWTVFWGEEEDWSVGHDSLYNMSISISQYAHDAFKLAFNYLNKGIWSLFGGPWSDFELTYLLVPSASDGLPKLPALVLSETNKDFILSDEYSTALLYFSEYDLAIDAKWLKNQVLWLNGLTYLPKIFCTFVYSHSLATEEDFDLANNMYETFVLAVNRLRQVLDKIHNGEISVKWENGILPDPCPSIPVPTPLDYNEVHIKDKIYELFDRFVDEMDLLAKQIIEMEHAGNLENTAYRADSFTVSEISSHIDEIQGLIELIRCEIKLGIVISSQEYEDIVKNIDSNSKFVRLVNTHFTSDETKSEAQAIQNKKIGEFIIAYRTLLLEFNCCIILYNQLKNGKELKPLASVNVSPMDKI